MGYNKLVSDFKFLQSPTTGKFVISAPRRAKRPDETKTPTICPFCPENIKEPEVYNEGGVVKVLANKFPFAPIHEVIIHSPDHHKNFGELDLITTELIFKTFRQRYNTHKNSGQVYIFHNRGEEAGESLFHPHSQLVVIPEDVKLEISQLEETYQNTIEMIQTNNYYILCPESSEWPDEVWIVPKNSRPEDDRPLVEKFGDISDGEITDLSTILPKVIRALELKLGREFPYNFYIYPKENWYLRVVPRIKRLGGFEIGTGVSVNTEDPKETIAFLKENLNL